MTAQRQTPAAAAGPRLWPFNAGGFLGPFGGAMVTPMLPELADGLGTSLSVAAWALSVYMIPFAALTRVVVNGLAVTSTPENRGGATSMTLSWQFLGSAIAPIAFLPIYHLHVEAAFLLVACGALGGAVVLALGRTVQRGVTRAGLRR